jgi:hypothetical protein
MNEGRWDEVPRLRQSLRKRIREDKECYWEAVATELEGAAERGDARKLFGAVRTMREGRRARSSVVRSSAGELVAGGAALKVWRERFADVVGKESRCEGVGRPEGAEKYAILDSPPDWCEVRKAVTTMKMRGAPGVDGVSAGLLRAGRARVLWWLVELFRRVWEKEEVPAEWSIGVVVPIFKKGDPTLPANYRGITLMVIAAKVLERVILNRIRKDREKRCRESQAGFRAGRSCGEQIFSLRRILEERHEWGLPVVAVALDFASAYDTVDQESLFKILEAEGMPPRTLAVVRALMLGSSARVRVDDRESEEFSVRRGVRQGSVLSPVLFVALMDWVLARALNGMSGAVCVGLHDCLSDLDYADDVLLLT